MSKENTTIKEVIAIAKKEVLAGKELEVKNHILKLMGTVDGKKCRINAEIKKLENELADSEKVLSDFCELSLEEAYNTIFMAPVHGSAGVIGSGTWYLSSSGCVRS